MKASTQSSRMPCERCGRLMALRATTAYEFDYRCVCGAKGRIAWAHANPPPVFRADPQQAELFR